MVRWHPFRLAAALTLAALFSNQFAPSNASAEFLRTATGVYQSMGRRAKIVVSTEVPGLFLFYGTPIDLQEFGADALTTADTAAASLHLFLKFDLQQNRYSAVVIDEHEYRVQGNFTVNLGDMRVTVDNTSQYCSIVVAESGHNPEIIGFVGTSAVINDEGQEAVEMLEANQFKEYREVFSPYTVQSDSLFVNGRPVSSGAVGLMVEPKNDCLKQRTAVISRATFQRLAGNPDHSKARDLLSDLLSRRERKNPLDLKLRLRTSNDVLILLDPIRNEAFLVRAAPVGDAELLPKGIDRICIIDPVSAEKKTN